MVLPVSLTDPSNRDLPRCGYGKLERAESILREKDSEAWKELTYMVFDSPTETAVLEQRLLTLSKINFPRYARVVEHTKITGQGPLNQMLETVLNKGGEGLVLRRPETFYQYGRSNAMLKLKPYDDDEAKVIENKENDIALCQFPTGVTFEISSKSPLPIGSIVTISYNGFANNKPKDPKLIRIRTDVTWNDVMKKHYPYHLSTGKELGGLPKCYGCKVRKILKISQIN